MSGARRLLALRLLAWALRVDPALRQRLAEDAVAAVFRASRERPLPSDTGCSRYE